MVRLLRRNQAIRSRKLRQEKRQLSRSGRSAVTITQPTRKTLSSLGLAKAASKRRRLSQARKGPASIHWRLRTTPRRILFQLWRATLRTKALTWQQRNHARKPSVPRMRRRSCKKIKNEPTSKELSIVSKCATQSYDLRSPKKICSTTAAYWRWMTTTPRSSTSWRSSDNLKLRSVPRASQARTTSHPRC